MFANRSIYDCVVFVTLSLTSMYISDYLWIPILKEIALMASYVRGGGVMIVGLKFCRVL